MGYTHYWYRAKEIDPTTFIKIQMDFERALPALSEAGIKLGNGYGLGFPIMDGENCDWEAAEQFYQQVLNDGLCYSTNKK